MIFPGKTQQKLLTEKSILSFKNGGAVNPDIIKAKKGDTITFEIGSSNALICHKSGNIAYALKLEKPTTEETVKTILKMFSKITLSKRQIIDKTISRGKENISYTLA